MNFLFLPNIVPKSWKLITCRRNPVEERSVFKIFFSLESENQVQKLFEGLSKFGKGGA
ncbi:MAG: hypothetical protein ACI9UV_001521 [Algoriphagus sp.]